MQAQVPQRAGPYQDADIAAGRPVGPAGPHHMNQDVVVRDGVGVVDAPVKQSSLDSSTGAPVTGRVRVVDDGHPFSVAAVHAGQFKCSDG
jgi:hypothetical protein